jgi:hypothetical protein
VSQPQSSPHQNNTHLTTSSPVPYLASQVVSHVLTLLSSPSPTPTPTSPPRSNTEIIISHTATPRELVSLLSKLHGEPTRLVQYTEQEYAEAMGKGGIEALGAALRRKWAEGDWSGYVDEAKGEDLELLVRGYL